MESGVMSMVSVFIGVAILLGVGTQILGNSVQDCTNLNDYVVADGASQADGTWAKQCQDNNASTQSAYGLLLVVLIVIAAIVILSIIKML
jgi:hypothetical protein